jgi:hypothetical protein
MDIQQFFIEFQDCLAPKLDTYEQAIYLYVFRHSRLIGLDEICIGFKSVRRKMAFGIGEKGKPMGEGTCYGKLQSLEAKGCLKLLGTERNGTRIRLNLPSEIPGLIVAAAECTPLSVEKMDFFDVPENRALILEREKHRCFYCLRSINKSNYVIKHVESRPEGKNTYCNLAAACRQCNNRKGAIPADEFLRSLYRDGFLGAPELQDRLAQLDKLRAGDLKPSVPA